MKKLDLVIATGTPEQACHEFLFQALRGPHGLIEGFGLDEKAAKLCCAAVANILTTGAYAGLDKDLCGDLADLANITAQAAGRTSQDITARVVFDKLLEHPRYAPIPIEGLKKVEVVNGNGVYIDGEGYFVDVVGTGVLDDIEVWTMNQGQFGPYGKLCPVVIYRKDRPRFEGPDTTIHVKVLHKFLEEFYEVPQTVKRKETTG